MRLPAQKRRYKIGIDASRAFVSEPTGVEYYSYNLIKKLSEIDTFNNYILYLWPGQKVNFTLPRNFKIKVINMRFLWTQFGLARELLSNPVDLIFVPGHTLPLLFKWVMREIPVVVTVHGLEGKYLPQSGNYLAHIYRNWSIEWSVKYADKLIAVSEDTSRDVVRTYQVASRKIRVIYEGVDFDRFGSRNQKSKVKSQKGNSKFKKFREIQGIGNNYILFVGTVQPRKNLIRLIQAFSMLIKKSMRKPIGRSQPMKGLQLVIVGGYGWHYGDILSAPARFDIKKEVVFTGRVNENELVELYRAAQMFVLPSLTEGFGLPVLEAQAAGVPVVASRAGALKEVAGEGAIYINPMSISTIEDALKKVLEDSVLRQDLVKKGYQNVQRYNWETTAYNTLSYFLEILERSRK